MHQQRQARLDGLVTLKARLKRLAHGLTPAELGLRLPKQPPPKIAAKQIPAVTQFSSDDKKWRGKAAVFEAAGARASVGNVQRDLQLGVVTP